MIMPMIKYSFIKQMFFNAAGHYKQKHTMAYNFYSDLITISPHIKRVIVAQPVIFKPL